jgi:hypothetical protein
VRDQVALPYKTTGKIILLYILIFTHLDTKEEDKRLKAAWLQASDRLIINIKSSDIPKYQTAQHHITTIM